MPKELELRHRWNAAETAQLIVDQLGVPLSAAGNKLHALRAAGTMIPYRQKIVPHPSCDDKQSVQVIQLVSQGLTGPEILNKLHEQYRSYIA